MRHSRRVLKADWTEGDIYDCEFEIDGEIHALKIKVDPKPEKRDVAVEITRAMHALAESLDDDHS